MKNILFNSGSVKIKLQLATAITTALFIKKIIVSHCSIKFFNFCVFFSIKIYLAFKKIILTDEEENTENLTYFLKKILKNIFVNTFLIKIVNLNKFLVKNSVLKAYRTFFKYRKTLFRKNLFFFFHFIKLTCLFLINKLNVLRYLNILADIFEPLKKEQHTPFLFFIKGLLEFFLLKYRVFSLIKGAKFIISGRLKGKLRHKKTRYILGQVPCQTINSNIKYNFIHSYTCYGTFGLKLWVNYAN